MSAVGNIGKKEMNVRVKRAGESVTLQTNQEKVISMTDTNPSIGSRSTCRECGQPIEYLGYHQWRHVNPHPAVPIDHAEPVKYMDHNEPVVLNAEQSRRFRELIKDIPEETGSLGGMLDDPSPATRTVEELVGEIRNMLTTCKYDAYDGCVTGDCPHEKQFECVGALAAMLTKRETEIDSSIAALEELARRLGVTHV